MQEDKPSTLMPKIGKLYSFRVDNKDELCRKYGYYYTGLAMCVEEDILKYLDKSGKIDWSKELFKEYNRNNILYRFDVYSCQQIFTQQHIYNRNMSPHPLSSLFLSITEIQDMLEEARKE